ncbi:Uncharacterised protein [Salmonella enterica subsp. enterica serovar Bovismorbificans]|uniref:Uncharacterized protein n=1 Tax=Salmonella enterica subsp. enterica serovar Bovismorbificans TaxID=58097 RepID=A0A655CJ64_SALET|nr:Uncharacterised protein [Salmonella enterica subsp. enterica serovar Bovismorbificans]
MRRRRRRILFFQRAAQHLIAHPAQVQAAAYHNDRMQPGHFFDDEMQAKQRHARPYHHAAGNAQYAHHRFFTRTADSSLRHEEKVGAGAH